MLEHHTATLVRVAEFFSKDPEVVGLILAGSLAHGFYTADSDVDVMLVVSDRDHAERLRTVRPAPAPSIAAIESDWAKLKGKPSTGTPSCSA